MPPATLFQLWEVSNAMLNVVNKHIVVTLLKYPNKCYCRFSVLVQPGFVDQYAIQHLYFSGQHLTIDICISYNQLFDFLKRTTISV